MLLVLLYLSFIQHWNWFLVSKLQTTSEANWQFHLLCDEDRCQLWLVIGTKNSTAIFSFSSPFGKFTWFWENKQFWVETELKVQLETRFSLKIVLERFAVENALNSADISVQVWPPLPQFRPKFQPLEESNGWIAILIEDGYTIEFKKIFFELITGK